VLAVHESRQNTRDQSVTSYSGPLHADWTWIGGASPAAEAPGGHVQTPTAGGPLAACIGTGSEEVAAGGRTRGQGGTEHMQGACRAGPESWVASGDVRRTR